MAPFTAHSITVLSEPLFGERLLPIETVYDPFISRGLDALNYACYQDARFIVVGKLPGVSLAAEGGAHQSIYEPLLGMAQPCLTSFGRPTPTSCARSCAGASSTSRPTTAGRPICACRRARWINRSGGWTRGWRGRQRTAAYCLAPPGPRAEVARGGRARRQRRGAPGGARDAPLHPRGRPRCRATGGHVGRPTGPRATAAASERCARSSTSSGCSNRYRRRPG